jgi:DNA-directed RNA polymerase beta' subunit
VRRIRDSLGSSVSIEYGSEYARDECILRLRPLRDPRRESLPGEDGELLKELCKSLQVILQRGLVVLPASFYNATLLTRCIALQDVLLVGIPGIRRTFVKGGEKAEFIVETEGTNLRDILGHPFVDATRTFTNDINEIFSVLGIEAAR